MLSLLWVFPALGALWIIGPDCARWFRAENARAGLRAVAFEHWIALLVLALHPAFVWLARHYRKTEPFRTLPPEDAEPPDPGGGN